MRNENILIKFPFIKPRKTTKNFPPHKFPINFFSSRGQLGCWIIKLPSGWYYFGENPAIKTRTHLVAFAYWNSYRWIAKREFHAAIRWSHDCQRQKTPSSDVIAISKWFQSERKTTTKLHVDRHKSSHAKQTKKEAWKKLFLSIRRHNFLRWNIYFKRKFSLCFTAALQHKFQLNKRRNRKKKKPSNNKKKKAHIIKAFRKVRLQAAKIVHTETKFMKMCATIKSPLYPSSPPLAPSMIPTGHKYKKYWLLKWLLGICFYSYLGVAESREIVCYSILWMKARINCQWKFIY